MRDIVKLTRQGKVTKLYRNLSICRLSGNGACGSPMFLKMQLAGSTQFRFYRNGLREKVNRSLYHLDGLPGALSRELRLKTITLYQATQSASLKLAYMSSEQRKILK